METTPAPIQVPTAKEKKYDRQLRLWAASGQRALEEAHVLLIVGDDDGFGSNSSVTGVEALKNLILPSVGQFTVADSAVVTQADLGVNFFLEAESLGKSRAAETKRLLEELNPDVIGHSISEKLELWTSDTSSSLEPYSLILLCAPVSPKLCQMICDHAQSNSVPLIYLHCAGFYSYFSVQLPSSFPIVDTHPDPDSTQDLRLLSPWPELSAEVAKLSQMEKMDDHDHGHIPYVLLLLHYLEEWKISHHGSLPSTYNDKTEFRKLVHQGARTKNAEGGEENFDEACAGVIKSINAPSVGSGCKDMFKMPACTSLNEHSANFWVIANAIMRFYQKHSVLPLPGGLPDMKARSADYISLQNTYKSKARADVAEVLHTVRATEASLPQRFLSGNMTAQPPILEAEIEQFCKNAAHVKVLTGTPLIHTRLERPEILNALKKSLNDPNALEAHLTPVFLALLRSEGWLDEPAMKDLTESYTSKFEEVQRANHGELHNIASLTGGQVAQEAIKLITRQYVPVDNVCVFDGIESRSEVLKF